MTLSQRLNDLPLTMPHCMACSFKPALLASLGLLVIFTAAPSAAQQQVSGQPMTGPGVLFSPFYYMNSGEPHDRHLRGVEQFSSLNGLIGPFTWTNPSPSFLATQLGADSEMAQEPMLAEPSGEGVASSHPFESQQGYGYKRLQGLEELPLPADAGGEVIPIPSQSEPEEIAPPRDASREGLADADSLGEEPEEPRLQFLRTATVLLEPGEMQVDVGFIYSLAENDFPVVSGGTDILEAHLKQRQLFLPLEFRFGVTPRMQAFVSAPIGWANNEFAVIGDFEDDENDGGLGDIGVGTSFLLFDGEGERSDVVFTIAATLPTGDSPFITASNGFNSPALGDNFWAISGDLIWINNYDPIVVFYGVGYRHQFEKEIQGVQVDPGEEARLQLGVGFAVNESVTLSTRFAASFITRTEFDGVSFQGSFSEPMTMRFAATISRKRAIVEPFAEIGSTDDATSTSFGVIWTY